MGFSLTDALIVMPALNESEAIADVIREVREHVPGATILVVNDGSNDDTAMVARDAGALVADLPCNLGVGGAVRCGFRFALRNNFPVVVQVDADGQHDPRSVASLISLLRSSPDKESSDLSAPAEADVVIGARFAGVGDYQVRGPRKWAMQILASILSKTVGTRLTDTTSGLKAHGPKAVEVYANDYPAEYLGDTVEALVIGSRAGLVFRQSPVIMRERLGGVPSHNPMKSALYLARVFMALVIAYLRPKPAKDAL